MDEKRIRCLQIVLQHVPIYLQQFPSYSNRKCKKSPFSRTAAHIFLSPGATEFYIKLTLFSFCMFAGMSAAIILGVAMVTVVYVAAIMVCFLYIRRCVFLYA